jgi:hypothetical protein
MKNLSRALAIAGALFAATRVATAATSDFLGTWKNSDPATRGIVKMTIAPLGSGLGVQAFGACSPTPCDWGVKPLQTYSDTVSDPNRTGGTANYDNSFSKRIMTIEFLAPNVMEVYIYTVFTDGSGRQPYRSRAVLVRD